MSAAADTLQPGPPAIVDLDDEAIRAALEAAGIGGQRAVALLAESTGLEGDALARALGAKLHYPVLDGAALHI